MHRNNYAHSAYPPPLVNIVRGYMPFTQPEVVGSSIPTQAPLGYLQSGLPTVWQGSQPQAIVGSAISQDIPSFVPQWTMPGQYQAVGQQMPGDANVNPFAASLAQRLLQPMHGGQHDKMSPVQLSPDDERILVHALKAGLAEGLTPRQIVERLQATDSDPGIGWKDVFLDNVERLFPQIFHSRAYGYLPYPSSQTQSSSSVTSSLVQFEPPRHQERHDMLSRDPSAHRRKRDRIRTRTFSNRHALAPAAATSTSQHSSPPKRRGSLLEYHDNTFIPPRTASSKPKAPDDARKGYHTRFTDDDKIFFIHFLRWRLIKGVVPGRRVLYRELAAETPTHNAEAWRKHWDSAPSLPDHIYIEARKRADNERALLDNDPLFTDSSEGEEINALNRSTLDSTPPPPTQASSRPAINRSNRRVTEEDLHKMAGFLVEKRHLLHTKSHCELWKEFARRTENKDRRTFNAWRAAARHYESQIQEYMDQLMSSLTDSVSKHREVNERTRPAQGNPPGRVSGSETSGHRDSIEETVEERSVDVSLKRPRGRSESVTDRDEKHVKIETIDLTD